ncbi:MAG: DUF3037 domain-containing protein [Dehalococcoidia bacterium]|nr:DUF3037 domain-containing protein [Dehalococcoidia bacterium]
MPAPPVFEYSVIRLVPRVEREEFLNVGVVLFCKEHRFLEARTVVDESRIRAFAPELDVEEVRAHLEAIRGSATGRRRGPLEKMELAERFRWLVAPRSTIIQASPVHSGTTDDPAGELEHLVQTLVAVATSTG